MKCVAKHLVFYIENMTRYVILLGQIFANTTKKESYEKHLFSFKWFGICI